MTNLTIIHYNDFTFELSYEVDGQFFEDIFVTLDPMDNVLNGLPEEIEDHEDQIIATIDYEYGDIVDDLVTTATHEYNDYVSGILKWES